MTNLNIDGPQKTPGVPGFTSQASQEEVSVSWAGREVSEETANTELLNQIDEVAQTQLKNPSQESGVKSEVSSQLNPLQFEVSGPLKTKDIPSLKNATGPATVSKPSGPRGMRYVDLSLPANQDLKKAVFQENLRYASYMYGKLRFDLKEGMKHGMQVTVDADKDLSFWNNHKKLSSDEVQVLTNIIQGLMNELGFNLDQAGNFYHPKTGTIFNLVYDTERKEVNICFMGLGNAHRVQISEKQKSQLDRAAIKATAANVVGGVPKSISQAVEIGKSLKKIIDNTEFELVMVGHSHGGALAQVAAIVSDSKGVVFNSEPLGVGVKNRIDSEIGKPNRKAFSENITAFSIKGDWLTGGTLNALSRFGRDHGMLVPTVMGQGYRIPGVDGDWMDKHNDFYEAILKLKDPPSTPENTNPS